MYLLVGSFNPFTVKVIIDMYDLITIFLIVLGLFCVGLFLILCFLLEKFLSIYCKADLVVLNFPNSCLWKAFDSPSNLNKNHAG